MVARKNKITGQLLLSLGFSREQIEGDVVCYGVGKSHCRLFLFLSQGGCDWWACVGKYQTPEEAARRCAHFDRRLLTEADVKRLCAAIGIQLPTVRIQE